MKTDLIERFVRSDVGRWVWQEDRLRARLADIRTMDPKDDYLTGKRIIREHFDRQFWVIVGWGNLAFLVVSLLPLVFFHQWGFTAGVVIGGGGSCFHVWLKDRRRDKR
jgi:hypothetical protein